MQLEPCACSSEPLADRHAEHDEVGALRRVLSGASLSERCAALQRLLALAALREEDVLALLVRMSEHEAAMSAEPSEPETDFERILQSAVERVRPAGGEQILIGMFRRRALYPLTNRAGLWAARVLASSYPDRACELLDSALESHIQEDRLIAAQAAALLPPAQARPRLLRACADLAFPVAQAARAMWDERSLGPCPVAAEPLVAHADVIRQMLGEQPSDRLRSQLVVLAGASVAERQAQLKQLLDEREDGEARVLFLFLLAEDRLLCDQRSFGLLDARQALCVQLCRRFGQGVLDMLGVLIARYPGEGCGGWLELTRRLLRANLFCGAEFAGLRQVLAGLVAEREDATFLGPALKLLDRIGAPESLRERLFMLCMQRDDLFCRASVVYGGLDSCPQLQAQLLVALDEALERRDYERFVRLTEIGQWYMAGAQRTWAVERVRAWQPILHAQRTSREPASWREDPGAAAAFEPFVYRLSVDGDELRGWVSAALACPDSAAFPVALRVVRGERKSDEDLGSLLAALRSPARDGSAAAEAAIVLVADDHVRPGDVRVMRAAHQAPPAQRGRLVRLLLERGVGADRLRPVLLAILTTDDPREATDAVRLFDYGCRKINDYALLQEGLAGARRQEVRRALERALEDFRYRQQEAKARCRATVMRPRAKR